MRITTTLVTVLVLATACAAAKPPVAKTSGADAVATIDVGPTADAGASADSVKVPDRADLQWDVTKAGPYGVGYRNWSHTYVPAPGDPTRTIGINLWYPTTEKGGAKALYMDWWLSDVAQVNAKATAPVQAAGYPVLVYSHGYSGFGGSSPWLPERFASHGWVVIAPDHTGNMLPDNDAAKPTALWWWRARDVSAAIDEVTANAAGAALAGKPLTDKVVIAGHSFGGYTTWCLAGAKFDIGTVTAACAAGKGLGGSCTAHDIAQYKMGLGDPRVVAAIPMMPGQGDVTYFQAAGMAAIHVPVLLMTGDADPSHEGPPTWQAMQAMSSIGNSLWVEVHNGCHQLLGLGMCGDVPAEDAARIGPIYTLAFARRWLLGDTGAATLDVLSGNYAVSALAKLSVGKAP